MSSSTVNWSLAAFTFVVWIGSTCWYFKDDIKHAIAVRKQRAAARRAAKEP